jgi:CDP-diacylglycerol--glycerol-3-phosphate 3-phosphatidyltransferase
MRADDTVQPASPTFTEILRAKSKGVVEPVAHLLNRLGIAPNTITLAGLVGNFIGAMFIARGNFLVGGLIVLAMGPMDALDGTMARLRGEATDFGAFVDSVVDRYIELVIFGGLLLHYLHLSEMLLSALVFIAACGTVLTSYVKARAEALGFQAKRGILTRVERFIVLAPCLILNQPQIAIVIIAVFANITALQRIYFVRRQAHQD